MCLLSLYTAVHSHYTLRSPLALLSWDGFSEYADSFSTVTQRSTAQDREKVSYGVQNHKYVGRWGKDIKTRNAQNQILALKILPNVITCREKRESRYWFFRN